MKESRSLTLVELVVVLALLVVVSTLALESTKRVVSQGRFDATTRQLDAIESAVVGDYGRPGPLPDSPFAGFVADTGGLPQLIYSNSDPNDSAAFQLGELWARSSRLQAYEIKTADAIDPDVILGTGWRGPYLRLSTASGDSGGIKDAWGAPFQFSVADSEAYAPMTYTSGSRIRALRSLGSNSGLSSDPYDREFRAVFQDVAKDIDRVTSSVSGTISLDPNDGNKVVVAVFGPDPDDGTLTASYAILDTPASGSLTYTSTDFTGPPITCGPRVIRAYQGTDLDPLSPPILSEQTTNANGKFSEIHRVELRPGGLIQNLAFD